MQAVPLSFFLFLAELAVGGLIVTTLLDWDGEVSAGFLFLNGAFLVAFGAAGIWLRTVFPGERLVSYAAERPWVGLEVAAWAAFVVVTLVQLYLIRAERRGAGRVAGTVAGIAGLTALVVSAASYAPPSLGALALPLTAATLLGGALALGTAWSAMMLGHWYLVTPLLAPRPLLRLNAAMAGALVAQGALAAVAAATGSIEPGTDWLYWLRALVGIVLPLALALPVWRTARVRSMMSATGLLYVALGCALAGEIIAKALLFVGGVPV
jgi:hypothetical protein